MLVRFDDTFEFDDTFVFADSFEMADSFLLKIRSNFDYDCD